MIIKYELISWEQKFQNKIESLLPKINYSSKTRKDFSNAKNCKKITNFWFRLWEFRYKSNLINKPTALIYFGLFNLPKGLSIELKKRVKLFIFIIIISIISIKDKEFKLKNQNTFHSQLQLLKIFLILKYIKSYF